MPNLHVTTKDKAYLNTVKYNKTRVGQNWNDLSNSDEIYCSKGFEDIGSRSGWETAGEVLKDTIETMFNVASFGLLR